MRRRLGGGILPPCRRQGDGEMAHLAYAVAALAATLVIAAMGMPQF